MNTPLFQFRLPTWKRQKIALYKPKDQTLTSWITEAIDHKIYRADLRRNAELALIASEQAAKNKKNPPQTLH